MLVGGEYEVFKEIFWLLDMNNLPAKYFTPKNAREKNEKKLIFNKIMIICIVTLPKNEQIGIKV